MKNKVNFLAAVLVLCGYAFSIEYYVCKDTGDDSLNGLSAAAKDKSGPFKTIRKAVLTAKPGDYIRINPSKTPYNEMIEILNRSGKPGAPITIDGQGSVLTGADPIDLSTWENTGNGLYKNTEMYTAYKLNPDIMARFFFVFDGRPNLMNRTSKGASDPFKKPEDLSSGEWTFAAEEKAFYIKTDPEKKIESYHIEVPVRGNGVAIYGDYCESWRIKNITAKHAYNDGYNIHGKTRDIEFHNIQAIENGDDGISAHDDCRYTVKGFVSIRNSTGICDTGLSETVYDGVFISGNYGVDVFFISRGIHTVKNAIVICNGSKSLHFVTDTPDVKSTVVLDNVLILGNKYKDPNARLYKNADITFINVTSFDLSYLVTTPVFSLKKSFFAGDELNIYPEVNFTAENNMYVMKRFRIGAENFSLAGKNIQVYTEKTGDSSSVWLSEYKRDFRDEKKSGFTLRQYTKDTVFAAERIAEYTKETELALTHGPKKPEIVLPKSDSILLSNSFDDTALFNSGISGTVGVYTAVGRWSAFTAKGAVVSAEKAHSGSQAIKVIRGGSPLSAFFAKSTEGADIEFSAMVFLEKSSFVAVLKDISGQDVAAVYILENGKINLRNFAGSPSYILSPLTIPQNTWVQLKITTDMKNNRYTAAVLEAGKAEQAAGIWKECNSAGSVNTVSFSPMTPDGSVTYIDDVIVVQKGSGVK